MHKRLFLIATFLMPSLALGQQPQSELNATLFLESVAMPKKAKACALRIPGFTSRYEPAFFTWYKSNQQRLAEGEKFLRSDAEKNNIPFQKNIDRVTDIPAQLIEKATQAMLEENCNAMLEKLGASSKNGG